MRALMSWELCACACARARQPATTHTLCHTPDMSDTPKSPPLHQNTTKNHCARTYKGGIARLYVGSQSGGCVCVLGGGGGGWMGGEGGGLK
jgi:hypothetical protein